MSGQWPGNSGDADRGLPGHEPTSGDLWEPTADHSSEAASRDRTNDQWRGPGHAGSHGSGYHGSYPAPPYGAAPGQPAGPGQSGFPPQAGYNPAPYPPPPYGSSSLEYSSAFARPRRSKVSAALLAFFLGALGIHNFYLGHTGRGIAQLLITVLSAGFLSWVSWIWALIEFILILTDSLRDSDNRPLI